MDSIVKITSTDEITNMFKLSLILFLSKPYDKTGKKAFHIFPYQKMDCTLKFEVITE